MRDEQPEGRESLIQAVRRTEICPDCIFRDDVDLLGRPRKDRHDRVRDCAGCSGRARVRVLKAVIAPWWSSGNSS